MSVWDEQIKSSTTVWNLGAILKSSLTIIPPAVNSITKSCFFQIRNSYTRRYLAEETSKISTQASYVSSQLDNMNSLMYEVPKLSSARLQNIRNNASRGSKRNPVTAYPCWQFVIGFLLHIGPNIKHHYSLGRAYMEIIHLIWHQCYRRTT